MKLSFARPDVSELVFRVFGRSVHPELISAHAAAYLRHSAFQADFRICDAGHVISFRHRNQVLTEATTTPQDMLPQRKRFLEYRIRGGRTDTLNLEWGLRYHISCQIERLDAEVFLRLHEELLLDSHRASVSHCFPSHNRLSPGAISLIRADLAHDSLSVHGAARRAPRA